MNRRTRRQLGFVLRELAWLPLWVFAWLFGENGLTPAEIRDNLRRAEQRRPRNEREIAHWRAELARMEQA